MYTLPSLILISLIYLVYRGLGSLMAVIVLSTAVIRSCYCISYKGSLISLPQAAVAALSTHVENKSI